MIYTIGDTHKILTTTTAIEYPLGPKAVLPNKLLREFLHDPIKYLMNVARTYGEICHFKFGKQHIYLLTNPEYIDDILIKNHKNFTKSKTRQVAKRLLGEGLVTSEGEYHDRQRRIIQPTFHPNRIKAYGQIVTIYGNQMCQQWKDGVNIDIHKELMDVTSAIISKAVLGSDVKSKYSTIGDALLTCMEYSNRVQMPLLQRDTKDSILQNFVNTGQVRFLFKDFTINDKPGDKVSSLAAEASYCAADQGKYWPFHDEIYKNSKGEYVAWVTKDVLNQFASNVNIPNIKKFSECLDSQNHSDIVQQNDNLANSIGLQATPSFILLSTGKSQQQPLLIDGAQPYSAFQQAIARVQSST